MLSRVLSRRAALARPGLSRAGLRRVGATPHTSAACVAALLQSQRMTLGTAAAFGVGRTATRAAVAARAAAAAAPARAFNSSSFLSGTNAAYVDEMYAQWRANPANVHASWDAFFRTGKYTPPPTLVADYKAGDAAPRAAAAAPSSAGNSEQAKLTQLIRAFQVRGHLNAEVDPLGLTPPRIDAAAFDPKTYGFTEADLDREFSLAVPLVRGFMADDRAPITLRKLVERLKQTYTTTIGWEFMHIPDVEQCNFLRERIELKEQRKLSVDEKLVILERLMWADKFERFLALKWSTTKRFGLDGGENTIPGMKALLAKSSELGVESVVIGMPHRGRLNVLSTVMRKPLDAVMSDFLHDHHDEKIDYEMTEGQGDVKYHLGYSVLRPVNKTNKNMHLTLLANPSHLEAVDPVVLGKARAKQFYGGDKERSKVMGVLLHGDAAFAGQGVVWETLALSELPDYCTGGTVHIVVNNQIGFTTDPAVARSTPYCTDLAKAVNAPIFHVNGDDAEAVTHVCEVAAEWRQKYKKDVVIDLICYRKFGHNERDEPRMTQPRMYSKIDKMPSSLVVYQQQLLKEGSVSQAKMDEIKAKIDADLNKAWEGAKTYDKTKHKDGLSKNWEGLKDPKTFSPFRTTGVPLATLKQIGMKITSYPDTLKLHKGVAKVMADRKKMIETGNGLDWGTAEALAFGTLLTEGKHVRLSGQDVERGTFTHRHAVLCEQSDDPKGHYYEPLNHVAEGQAVFSVSNSNLSEYAILGFELGYSMENPHALVLWEAQFGDFANGAQIIIDQFLSSGEDKWNRQSGLVMLLPHGYEGQGPEHSSARLERYLQGSKEHPDVIPDKLQIQQNNWQVIWPTTPANYFHALRRQIHRDFRKPLIVMSPKSFLREPLSTLAEMAEGTKFEQVLADKMLTGPADKVRRVIFCSGHVYYDLQKHRAAKKIADVAVVRVEQLSPFPFRQVLAEAQKYPKAKDLVWCQEEPMNMGAWTHVSPRFETALKQAPAGSLPTTRPRYVGRPPSASTSAGSADVHERELAKLLSDAFAA